MLFSSYGLVGGISSNNRVTLLGALENIVFYFTANLSITAQYNAAAQYSGSPTCATHFGLSAIPGAFAFKLPPKQPGRFEKPIPSTRAGGVLAQDLRLAVLVNEQSTHNQLFDAVTGSSAVTINGGTQLTGADNYGSFISNGGSQFVGPGWSFGSGDFVTCPSTITVFAMFSIDPAFNGGTPVVSKSGTGIDWIICWMNPGWRVAVNTVAGTKTLDFSGTGVGELVGFTYDGVTLIGYLNGIARASSVINSLLVTSTNNNVEIGYNPQSSPTFPGPSFRGNIYAVYMWSRVLSPAHVTALWENPYNAATLPLRRRIIIAPPVKQNLGVFSSNIKFTNSNSATVNNSGNGTCVIQFTPYFVANGYHNSSVTTAIKFTAKFDATSFTETLGQSLAAIKFQAIFIGSLDAANLTCITASGKSQGGIRNYTF